MISSSLIFYGQLHSRANCIQWELEDKKSDARYELKYIADELPNSLEAEISGGNQLIMNYEQAQELFGIKFRRWLGIFNL